MNGKEDAELKLQLGLADIAMLPADPMFADKDPVVRDQVPTYYDVAQFRVGLCQSSVKSKGEALIEPGFAIIDAQIAGSPFAAGGLFPIADVALTFVEPRTLQTEIALPTHVQAHCNRMLTRPGSQTVRTMRGEA